MLREWHLHVVPVDLHDLLRLLGARERARDGDLCSVGQGTADRQDVAVLLADGIRQQSYGDAALLREKGRIDVADRLADDIREDALEGGELEHVDVEFDDLAADLDIDVGDRIIGERREHLAQLLHEGDAGTHARVDDPARDVDGVRHELAVEGESHRPGDRDAGLLLCFIGGRTEVRGHDDVLESKQGRVGGRLIDEDIETGSGDATRLERRVQRILIDQAAPGHVDNERRRLHQRKLVRRDHPGRLGRLRHVDGDEVGLGEQFIQSKQCHAELLGACRGHVWVIRHDVGAEGLHPRGDERTDAAEPDDADGLLVEFDAGVLRAFPQALGQRTVGRGDVAGEAQDVTYGQLGGRDDVRGRSVHDHHTGGRRRLDVDVVETYAGTGDHLEADACRDCLLVHLRGGADQHCAGVRERREQRRPVGAVDVSHVEIGAKGLDGSWGKFFGDQHDRLGHGIESFD